jgi:hypothetical protein
LAEVLPVPVLITHDGEIERLCHRYGEERRQEEEKASLPASSFILHPLS